jgi:hypothetical protein
VSTRTAIIFIGANNYDGTGTKAVRLYQHCDGYPTNVLPTLRNTLKVVRKKSEDHWQHISYKHPRAEFDFLTVPIHAETMAGCYIAEETSGFGMGARLEEIVYLDHDIIADHDEETLRKIFGNQGDLEWIYVVNSIDRSITVFGGGYTGKGACETVSAGEKVNPLSYIKNLVDEYQESEGAVIKSALRSLSRIGFPVNPERESGRRAAHAAQRDRLRTK